MKKLIYICITLIIFAGVFTQKAQAQDTNNVVLEMCTGTWCGYCPCGHVIADNILTMFPSTLLIEYHGGSSTEPFKDFTGNQILTALGFPGYPTGVIGRRTGAISRGSWTSQVSYQRTFETDVRIALVQAFNSTTRVLTLTANVTSLRAIDSTVLINFVFMENIIKKYN